MPPPGHRKKPFSAKQKKRQLQDKRDRRRDIEELGGNGHKSCLFTFWVTCVFTCQMFLFLLSVPSASLRGKFVKCDLGSYVVYHLYRVIQNIDEQTQLQQDLAALPGGGGGGGTPYVMGDTYVPRFWPPFFTLAGSSTIFLGYFFSSTNTKTIFWGIKTTNSYRIRSFRPQISFFPRSFWVQFSAASGTPPSFFGPSTPPGAALERWSLD